jgi:hypothetical protein
MPYSRVFSESRPPGKKSVILFSPGTFPVTIPFWKLVISLIFTAVLRCNRLKSGGSADETGGVKEEGGDEEEEENDDGMDEDNLEYVYK